LIDKNRTRRYGYKLYKNTGTLKKRLSNARVVNPWSELDEKTVKVDTVDKSK